MSENPFEEFDLEPSAGPEAITDRLRELAENADAARRTRLREAWQALTLHPARRLAAALGAHPETRVPLGAPPPPVPIDRAALGTARDVAPAEMVLPLSVAEALGPPPSPAVARWNDHPTLLEEDPILMGGA
jgi:hypothetical protein